MNYYIDTDEMNGNDYRALLKNISQAITSSKNKQWIRVRTYGSTVPSPYREMLEIDATEEEMVILKLSSNFRSLDTNQLNKMYHIISTHKWFDPWMTATGS